MDAQKSVSLEGISPSLEIENRSIDYVPENERQSRAQFGFRGVVLPLIATISLH